MIVELDNKKPETAHEIREVFQVSYAVEAELLGAVDFPPLQRVLDEFINCATIFYGIYKDSELAGVIEIDQETESSHIQSLVVKPTFFRQGIARNLIDFALTSSDSATFTVETGVDNAPAKKLYHSFGFRETKEWDTSHSIRKVRFEKSL